MAKLSERQKRFCEYYIASGNATESAIKAGYSKKTANVIACENLTKPYIKAYIDEINEQNRSDRIATAQEIKEFFTSVMRGEIKEEVVQVVQDEVTKLNKAVKIMKETNIKDRLLAGDKLGKIYAMFTDKVQVAQELVVFSDENLED